MRGAAGQRLRPLELDAARLVGREIKPAYVRQNVLVAMLRRKLAEPAGTVVDPEFKAVVGSGLDEIVDKVAGILLLLAQGCLLAHQGLVLRLT